MRYLFTLIAVLLMAGCPSYGTSKKSGFEEGKYLGRLHTDVENYTNANDRLLKMYFQKDADNRMEAVAEKYAWILDQYEAAGQAIPPADAMALMDAYLDDHLQLRNVLDKQLQNIRELKAHGQASAKNLEALAEYSEEKSKAIRESQKQAQGKLREFFIQSSADLAAAYKVRQSLEAQEAEPPEEPVEEPVEFVDGDNTVLEPIQ